MRTAKADAQADLSLRWTHRSFCWFCRAAAHIRIWHPAKEIKRGKTINTTFGITYKTIHMEGYEDSCFLADGHHAILKKANKMFTTNRKWANNDNENKPQ